MTRAMIVEGHAFAQPVPLGRLRAARFRPRFAFTPPAKRRGPVGGCVPVRRYPCRDGDRPTRAAGAPRGVGGGALRDRGARLVRLRIVPRALGPLAMNP